MWEEKRLGEVINVNPSVKIQKGEMYPFIDIDKVSTVNSYVSNVELKLYEGQSCSKFEDGDTVFSRITPCLENRKIAKTKLIGGRKAFGSTEFFVFRGIKGVSDSNFVYYYVSSDLVVLPAINSMTGASGRQRADRGFIESLKINLPPLPTQQKIADILSAYDDLIENNNRRIQLLEQAAQQLYKEWFVRFRFPGHEKVHFTKGLPDGWEVKKIGHIADIMSGGTPKTDNGEYYGGDIPFYTPKDYNDRFFISDTQTKITYAGLKNCNSKLYPENTIVITARGTVGKINILSRPMAMNQSCYALKCELLNSPYYLFFSLKNEVDKLLKMANGGVFETIIVSTFNYIQMFVPNNELIIDFDKKVSPIMDECVRLQSKNQNLIKQRDLLLPRLMSGKLEV